MGPPPSAASHGGGGAVGGSALPCVAMVGGLVSSLPAPVRSPPSHFMSVHVSPGRGPLNEEGGITVDRWGWESQTVANRRGVRQRRTGHVGSQRACIGEPSGRQSDGVDLSVRPAGISDRAERSLHRDRRTAQCSHRRDGGTGPDTGSEHLSVVPSVGAELRLPGADRQSARSPKFSRSCSERTFGSITSIST